MKAYAESRSRYSLTTVGQVTLDVPGVLRIPSVIRIKYLIMSFESSSTVASMESITSEVGFWGLS